MDVRVNVDAMAKPKPSFWLVTADALTARNTMEQPDAIKAVGRM